MALTQEQINQFSLEERGGSGFGMKDYDYLVSLGATNRQLVEIAMNAPVIGDVARQSLISNFDVSQGFGQLANEQLTRLGATKDQIISIASNAPVIGDRVIKQYPELEKVDYNIRHANLKSQLQSQYETLVAAEPKAAYGGRQSDIDKIFFNQAKKLADKGVGDLSELTERVDDQGNRYVINRNTGDDLFKINKDRDTGVNKWGDVFSGVKDGANFGIEFDPEGRAVLFPVHEKTKGLAQQLVGRDLAKLVTPIATVAGAIYGGPAGAAAGSAVGQYATSGEIDPLKVALAAGATYAGQSLFGGATPSADLTGTTTGGMLGADAGFQVAQQAGAGAGTGLLGADAAFIADYANRLAGQGLGEAAIAQNLVEAGVDTANATLAANLAVSGSGISEIANTLSSFAPTGATSLFTGTGADLANFGITAGGTGVGLTEQQLQAIQAGQIAGNTFAEQVANVQQLIPGGTGLTVGDATTGATATKDLLDKLGDTVTGSGKNLLSGLLGDTAGNLLTDLLGAGINYGIDEATVKRLVDLAQQEKTKVQEGFRDLAAKSEVPFTPYTVSTGFGTSTFGPEQATTALSPEYAGIRDTAIAKSAEALRGINPATATQDYYNTLEALSAPTRQREQERLLGTLGSRGLLGFGQNMPTTGGMTRTVNPLMESLLSAQATERLQQSLTAQQYGTSEAQRQAALSSSLLGMGTGLDTTALNQLSTTATLGQIPYDIDVANRERQIQQLENALRAGIPYDEAVLNLSMGKEANLGDFYRKTAENIFNEIFG